jgi:hypothetical protein
MRARELHEDYSMHLDSDLNDLLIGAKGNNAQELDMQDLVMQLQNMGYAVNKNSLMILLGQNPNVLNATPQSVTLKGPESTMEPDADTGEDSADQVADMAQNATKLG